MNFIKKIFSYFIGNITGLLISQWVLTNIVLTKNLVSLFTVAGLLLMGQLLVRPILKLLLSPLIFITIGLFTIVINAIILAMVDFTSPYITINGLPALLYCTLIISAVHIIIRQALRKKSSEEAGG